MIRILVADDHAILRRGLMEMLDRELPGVVWGEASSGDHVLDQVHKHAWDLVILDISMPGRSGLEILGTLKAITPNLPVLMLSMHPEDLYGKRVLQAGASGYVSKESAPDELVFAVRKVLSGRRYVSAALAEILAADVSPNSGRAPHEKLSDREFEVLRLIAVGKTVSQIAEDLHLGASTVSTYRARILEKLNLSTTAELMRYALRHRIVE
jgi:two-component system invasion response regulator UvrY